MTETQDPRAVVAVTDVAVHRRTTGQEIVLDGINWTVRPGEHWALLGRVRKVVGSLVCSWCVVMS
ncbi:hypothetical protein [Streptomyces misionensis]|uniref:hypothetical protein n=1 Tax=Streptomyces misionensis TaxID=67331 RepID=UPI003F4B3A19